MITGWIVTSFGVVVVGSVLADKAKSARWRTFGQSITGLALASLVAALLCGLVVEVVARDVDGRFAQSPLKPWFDGLRSGKGPCCSDADGYAISDVDWEAKDGHYRVRIPRASYEPLNKEMIWLDVPDDAVITEPNRAGRTMVWPIWGYQGPSIRCFMPGSMT